MDLDDSRRYLAQTVVLPQLPAGRQVWRDKILVEGSDSHAGEVPGPAARELALPGALVKDFRGERAGYEPVPTYLARFFHPPEEGTACFASYEFNSERFWRAYQEPLVDFLDAVDFLVGTLRALLDPTAGLGEFQEKQFSGAAATARQEDVRAFQEVDMDRLASLAAGSGLALARAGAGESGSYQARWSAPSLLGLIATMVTLDLAGGKRAFTCLRCHGLLLARPEGAKLCSKTCRGSFDQANSRRRVLERQLMLHDRGISIEEIARMTKTTVHAVTLRIRKARKDRSSR